MTKVTDSLLARLLQIKADNVRLSSECEALREALAEEREENLWNAYNSGHVKDGRWTHMFMSDGEWLARMCGFDPKEADYDDATIRAAIPVAAHTTLQGTNGGGK